MIVLEALGIFLSVLVAVFVSIVVVGLLIHLPGKAVLHISDKVCDRFGEYIGSLFFAATSTALVVATVITIAGVIGALTT